MNIEEQIEIIKELVEAVRVAYGEEFIENIEKGKALINYLSDK